MGERSVSRQLTAHAVANLVAQHAGAKVAHLDLVKDAPNHLAIDSLAPRLGLAEADLSPAQRAEGLNTGDEPRQQAIASAQAALA